MKKIALNHAFAFFAAAAAAALLGCDDVPEEVNPRPVASAPVVDAGADDAGDDAAPPDSGAPAPKRTVEQRNPFGNVAVTDNLLWDGDFEWTSPFSDQYGWLAGPPFGYNWTNTRVGAICRSGLKCAAVKKKKAILGIAVASKGNKLDASFWAHLKADTCDKVKAYVTSLYDNSEPDAPLDPDNPAPDPGGWCHYSALIDAREGKPYFYIQNNTSDEILVDDVILRKAPNAAALRLKSAPPTAEDAQALAEAREQVRGLRGPHDPPPNAAKRAHEAWVKQR